MTQFARTGQAGDHAFVPPGGAGAPFSMADYIAANFTSPTGLAYLKQPDGSVVAYSVPYPPGYVPPTPEPGPLDALALPWPSAGSPRSNPFQPPPAQSMDPTPAPPGVVDEFPATGQVGSPAHQRFRQAMIATNAHPRHSLRVARRVFGFRS